MAALVKSWLLSAALSVGLSAQALAQSIEVGSLGEARPFETGVLDSGSGGLDRALWQNTSASRAMQLIDGLPANLSHPVAKDLARAALLSAGSPPNAANEDEATQFQTLRFDRIFLLGDIHAAKSLVERTSGAASNRGLAANMALLSGDTDEACDIAEQNQDNRAAPQWAKLRAFCLTLSGETSAAELTTDLLRSSGYENPLFYTLMTRLNGGTGKVKITDAPTDPLLMTMLDKTGLAWPNDSRPAVMNARQAMNTLSSPAERLSALWASGNALSDSQIEQVLDGFVEPQPEIEANETDESGTDSTDTAPLFGDYNLDKALKAPAPQKLAQLYWISRFGQGEAREQAITEILKLAETNKAFERFSVFLTPAIQTIPAQRQAALAPDIYVRAAIMRGDIGTLQQFHGLMADKPAKQERIALSADALAYGFIGGGLGEDIEARLKAGDKSATRDAIIALAMGASLSDKATLMVEGLKNGAGRSLSLGQTLALDAAATKGARAETALLTAAIMSGSTLDNDSLYKVLSALNRAGLTAFAGKIAAYDLWARSAS